MNRVARSLELLSRWSAAAETWWCEVPGHAGLGFYGTGYNHWGVQTNQKYLGAMAALAVLGEGVPGCDRERARDRALAALRYSLATHLSGGLPSADGSPWGHTWISALGIERMLYGVRLLEPFFRDEDRAALRRVLCSEADWLAREHVRGSKKGVTGGLWGHEGSNAPESNLWNGALLWRTAELYPESPGADHWREMAHRFLINAVNVPADEGCATVVAGKPVRERFVGPNFFPNYALDHHGYMNVGYMVICASNAGILHFDLKQRKLARPESLDWHQQDLWQVLRKMLFADGRLARIGGDSRVRYTYCQEYLAPAAFYAADRWKDAHAIGLVDRYLDLVAQEAAAGTDGSFYGARLHEMAATNPYYYSRLESDRACALGMIAAYTPDVQAPEASSVPFETTVAGGWIEPMHAAALHRSPTRLAAFSWRSYGLGQGMCQPPGDGHLADWQQNLGGKIEFVSDETGKARRRLLGAHVASFEGGFAASGAIMEGVDLLIAEGWRGTDSAVHRLAFVALPDDHTVVGIEYAVNGQRRAWLKELHGMHWLLPNDLFNGGRRELATEIGSAEFETPPPAEAVVALGSRWACLDGQVGVLGLYGGQTLAVHRTTQRRGGRYRSLHVEAFGWPARAGLWAAQPGEVLLDCAWMAAASVTAEQTRTLAQANAHARVADLPETLRAVRVRALDGKTYVVAFNLTDADVPCEAAKLLGGTAARNLISGTPASGTILLPAGAALVFQVGS
ncbi:MAG: hypothetical protein KIS92_11705 [Planctomycetota bacterium]|nr:hypothetical protein [Planctomycetota bacterium]